MFDEAPLDAHGRAGLDPTAWPTRVYGLLNTVVLPRPIAWVSTRSADGVDNLAPHSYFTIASTTPPVVQFTSVGTKDTLRNALATGEFVVSICTEDLLAQVNLTAAEFPAAESEFDAAGLTREPSALVAPPRVGESPVALECRVVGTQTFGESTVVFGEVVWLAIRPEVVREDHVAVDLLRPIARLGGADYCPVREVVTSPRIRYADVLTARTSSDGTS